MIGNLVYHYTSLESFFNIIQNRSFWLTDLRSTIDKNDMAYGENLVKEYGRNKYNKLYPDFAPSFNQFALSCTTERDSFFHFQCYSDNCKGVAIGIDPLFMENGLNNKQFVETLHYHLKFQPIIYDVQKQRNILERYYFNNTNIQNNLHNDLDYLNDKMFADAFTCCCSEFKKPEFKSENEIRFVYMQDYSGSKTKITLKQNGEEYDLNSFLISIGLDVSIQMEGKTNLKYRVFKNRIRKYYDFNFSKFGINNVIRSVIIGPKCKQNLTDLNDFLYSNQFDACAQYSEIELRD